MRGRIAAGALLGVLAAGPGQADPLARSAPGRDDTSALRAGRWTAPLTTSVEFGTARPWGDLPVRTDWIELRWAAGRFGVALSGARTDAGTVGQTELGVDAEFRSATAAVRLQVSRRGVTVESFAPRAVRRTRVGARRSVGPARAVLVVEHDPERVRPWSWALGVEVDHRGLRARLDHRPRRHTVERAWSVAASLDLAGSLDLGFVLDAEHTTWSLAVRHRPWGLRVGRVVDGPREGAVAVALEWRP
jgi:hypothetical protein